MTKQELIASGFKEFEKDYYINNLGLVYSFKTQKFIKSRPSLNGYMTTEICLSNKKKKIYNHIKVVQMFGDRNGNRIYPGLKSLLAHGISIDHVDNNRLNPKQSNLELVAHQLNCERRELRRRQEELIEELF